MQVLEGVLDQNLDNNIDKDIISAYGDWIINFWKDIKWVEGGSRWYKFAKFCPDLDRDETIHKLRDFGYDSKKAGRKSKCTEKVAKELLSSREDKVLVIVQFARNGDISHIGIGHMQSGDGIFITDDLAPYQYSPQYKEYGEELRMICWPSSQIDGYSQGRTKKDYYVLPGHYWNKIKDSILN